MVTWESTIKCNLDCSYCSPAEHDNSVPHPLLEDCLKTADFLLDYANLYMKNRPDHNKIVSFHIFGGESLFHPNIVDILEYTRRRHKEKYNGQWILDIQVITNAVVKPKVWNRVVELIDGAVVSYHSEATKDQQAVFRKNALYLKNLGKHCLCSILIHPRNWDQCMDTIEWAKENNFKYVVRQLDHSWHDFKFYYTREQAKWLRGDSLECTSCNSSAFSKIKESVIKFVNMESKGRECCSGEPLHVNGDYTTTQTFIPNNKFKGWSCGVNQYFVFVKQVTGEVFTNKDCRMNFNGKVGPIGYLSNTEKILTELQQHIDNNTLPVITCNKSKCWCGLCAPKASTRKEYNKIIKNHVSI